MYLKGHLVWGVLFLLPTALAGGGKKRGVIVLSDRSDVYVQIAKGVRQGAPGDWVEIVLEPGEEGAAAQQLSRLKPARVVAVGDLAAFWVEEHGLTVPVLAAGVVRKHGEKIGGFPPGVSLDFPPGLYLAALRVFLNDVDRVGLLYDPSRDDVFVREAQKTAKQLGLDLNAQPMTGESDIGQSLHALKEGGVAILIVTCDPLLLNQTSWNYLVKFSLENHVGLLVPSDVLLRGGGLLSLEPDYVDLGRQAVRCWGHPAPQRSLRYPDKKRVGFNAQVGNALGRVLSPAALKKVDYVVD